jgi:tryptophan halogenase
LQSNLPGKALGTPRQLSFTPGRRQKAWHKNVLALGLASGFLEPLESTSLHLVHSGITALLNMFPDRRCHEALQGEYNRRFAIEMERIRDFLILHYKLNQREDSEMWRYCAHMPAPQSLQERLALFNQGGHLQIDNYDLFGAESWLAVHLGQGNYPGSYNPLLDFRPVNGLQGLSNLRHALEQTAQSMPTHAAFLDKYLGVLNSTPS